MRADAITRTGVIQPYFVRQVSPVAVAQHTIDPFIWAVRETGWEACTPWEMQAAHNIAKHFVEGKAVTVSSGGQTATVAPGALPPPGPTMKIVMKAYDILKNLFAKGPAAAAATPANVTATPMAPSAAAADDSVPEAGTRAVYIPPPS